MKLNEIQEIPIFFILLVFKLILISHRAWLMHSPVGSEGLRLQDRLNNTVHADHVIINLHSINVVPLKTKFDFKALKAFWHNPHASGLKILWVVFSFDYKMHPIKEILFWRGSHFSFEWMR